MEFTVKIYAVGGSVRDKLLGLPVKDKDYVVVGTTQKAMKALGYKPVGRYFPVFLHPVTHEEYALARTEKKVTAGYHGFIFHADHYVTLEEDLARRDLTINAMAEDENGSLIDLFGGKKDLKNGLLRHINESFAEDPVRILRVARFAARYQFSIHSTTLKLMKKMVAAGEVAALQPSRIWQEMAKGLMEKKPLLFFDALHQCGALNVLLPEIIHWYDTHKKSSEDNNCLLHSLAFEYALNHHLSLAQRFAILLFDFDNLQCVPIVLRRIVTIASRLNIPKNCLQLALSGVNYFSYIEQILSLDTNDLMKLFCKMDVFRKTDHIQILLDVCCALLYAKNIQKFKFKRFVQIDFINFMLKTARSIDMISILKKYKEPSQIADAIFKARVVALEKAKEDFIVC
jgi:tRNA nucleotidyltransferase (CCA-adding enzyme)